MSRLHVAITMDGNGRWAELRGLPRQEGHQRGAASVRRVVDAAAQSGITTLTLYAFSANNWRRPKAEVMALMAIFDVYLGSVVDDCLEHDIRFSLIGRRDRLPPSIRRRAAHLEETTRAGRALHLRIAIDYSAREAIWLAAQRLARSGACSREAFDASIRSGSGAESKTPDVDLLIRTGGEQRLSDFLLWESAYAELWFTDVLWPDFEARHLAAAIASFERRERRFGGLPARPASAV
jgi:undecaprenyl diphosphate synthase